MANSNESPSSGRQQGSQQHGAERTQSRGQQSAFQAPAAEQQSSRAMQTRPSTTAVPSYFGGPFSMMRRISEDMDRLFESFGFGRSLFSNDFGQDALAGFGGGEGTPSLWAPHVAVYERDGKFIVSADLPGVRKEDVNVEITQDALTIQGHRTQEKTSSAEGFYHSEQRYGGFYRRIPLPETVDSETASASFRDGVLHIQMNAPQLRLHGRTLQISDGGSTTTGSRASEGGASQGTGGGSAQQR